MHDSNPGTVAMSPGGVARNVAENLARLGTDCRLISAVGADPYGDVLLEDGRTSGIDMSYMLQIPTAQTSTYVSVLDNTADMLVAINDMSIVDELTPDYLRTHELMLKRASLVIADTNLCESSFSYLGETLFEQPLFVDLVSSIKAPRITQHLHSVHTVKASRIEAETLSGMSASSNEHLPAIANWFHERGVERVFITLGADGTFFSAAGEQVIETAGKVKPIVVNTSGAGDAFLAGIAYAWLQQWSLRKSVRFANAAAIVAISHRSTNNPDMSVEKVNDVHARQYGQ